jgi:hypothetical protein
VGKAIHNLTGCPKSFCPATDPKAAPYDKEVIVGL